MKRVFHMVLIVMLGTTSFVMGQAGDVAKVIAEVRAALGGDAKLSAVKTMTIEGKTVRPAPDGTSRSAPFEVAMELPDKYARKDELGNINGMSISRTAGFNGGELIEEMDTPNMGGGHVMMFRPGTPPPGVEQTPEQIAAQRQATILASRKDFARLTLGMFASSFPAFPVEFAYAGQAEAPEGKAHVIDVRGEADFAAKLFVDTATHLPLMLSWMDKEPLRMQMSSSAGGPGGVTRAVSGGGGMQVVGGAPGRAMTPEDAARMREEMAERMKEAEANRRTVEYRLFYSDYKAFDGVRLPTRVQRMIDGAPTEELEIERVKINPKIDPRRFAPVKDEKSGR